MGGIVLPESVYQDAINAFHGQMGAALHKDGIVCSAGVRAAVDAVKGQIIRQALSLPSGCEIKVTCYPNS